MFKNAWNLGRYFGIPVKIHWTFLLIILYVVSSSFMEGTQWSDIIIEVVFLLTMFFCVVLHEFGHALTAKRYGVETEDIVLLPIGGVARLRNMPEKPKQELIIAIMGPMVNVIIAIIIFCGLLLFNKNSIQEADSITRLSWQTFFPLLMISNIFLLIFNMIPAFPMDGGRVLRSLLAMKFGRLNATKWASRLGQFICIIFIGIGIYYQQWNAVLIGVFIFFGAMQEYQAVVSDAMFKNINVGQACRKIFRTLVEHISVSEAYQLLLSGAERNFPVINLEGNFSGFVSSRSIIEAYKANPNLRIMDIMNRGIKFIHPDTSLANIIPVLNQGYELLIVSNLEETVGVLDKDSINHFMELQK